MKIMFTAIALLAGLTMEGTAQADVGVTGEAGTTGAGIHIDVPVRPNLNVRFGTGYIAHSSSESTSGMNYDLKHKLSTVDALLDWYPFNDRAFRLSAGVVYNNHKADVLARTNSAGNYTIQGNTYSATSAGEINGKIGYRKIAPYAGIGWGGATGKNKGWSFTADVGVLLQGSPHTSLTSTGCTSPTAMCSQLVSDLEKESSALTSEAGRYKAYPVLRVGVRYQF
ncbi:MAG: hypothetical protein JWQ21_974 [Herminiimonas sp.]|nr:hypothetical protein [Herminiimonas sp.]